MNIHSYQFISSLDLVIKRKFLLLHLLNGKRVSVSDIPSPFTVVAALGEKWVL